MATLAFPTVINPSRMGFFSMANTQGSSSPFDQTLQTVEFPGILWRCRMQWDKLDESHWRIFSSFVASMRGTAGRVYVTPLHASTPIGPWSGAPLVDGASQIGDTITLKGFTPSVTNIVRVGDFFSYDVTGGGRQMHLVKETRSSDGSGRIVALKFDPPIRRSPANNAVITTIGPSCVMRFVDDEQGQFEFEPPVIGNVSLDLIEAPL
jgi:hypothetical protein